MTSRDVQNQTVSRALSESTGAVPLRNAITQMAQASNIAGTGALPPMNRYAKGPLLCDVTPIGEGLLGE